MGLICPKNEMRRETMKGNDMEKNSRGSSQTVESVQKRTPKILLAGVLVIVLIGAAYALGCYLAGDGSRGESSTIIEVAGGVVTTELEVAEELPKTQPTIWGIVDHVQDNSIYVTQLPPLDQIAAQMSVDFGPTEEVVVTSKTIIYEVPPYGGSTNGVIHEVVIPGSVDEIGESHLVTVWGERRGDRIVADVLKYNTHSKIVLPTGPIN
jgi:hypothetical protein